ncbi:unnamed protein product [Fraxinus pennsylvanica]|uniref:Uncharacterized protein n=1 Tax=Fraxinus pennsylvanica TaxID=56036 RepID=A0AAD1Z226_9LAMI|nr:unnamed protein product [Fraxinus pennsylvanica]
MFSLPNKTVFPFCRNLGDTCLYRSSVGVPSSDLPKIIAGSPALLAGSIEKQFIPCYNFLRTLVGSDEDIVRTLKRSPRILTCNLKVMVTNVELLEEAGVQESFISFMLTHYPHSLQMKCDKFKTSVSEAIKMGFDPSRMMFIHAIHVLCERSEQAWENKIKVYRSFGLSHTEILLAFRSHPFCMKLSEQKIKRVMEFYVNEMSWSPSNVAQSPIALFYNMERRIIPRCRVVKILMEKGLVKKYSISNFLSLTDRQFLKRFVHNYKNDLPEIMDVYHAGQFVHQLILCPELFQRSGTVVMISFCSCGYVCCRVERQFIRPPAKGQVQLLPSIRETSSSLRL